MTRRKGARRMADVPLAVLSELAAGHIETANLMEWLAADLSGLARAVAEVSEDPLRSNLKAAADNMMGRGILDRLKAGGRGIALARRAGQHVGHLDHHGSDLVRQWACYAANDEIITCSLGERLESTRRFADDPNMSVREAAWMAFRPHLALQLEKGIALLEAWSVDPSPNIRRFAVEVTRPRSVWGGHLATLKRNPELAIRILHNVKNDPSRYVQLAAGNWINDASKSQPGWAAALCASWATSDEAATAHIVRRGGRTLRSANLPLLALAAANTHERE